ncbi:hypothetical protein ES703_44214 [subsurface metagenome]
MSMLDIPTTLCYRCYRALIYPADCVSSSFRRLEAYLDAGYPGLPQNVRKHQPARSQRVFGVWADRFS